MSFVSIFFILFLTCYARGLGPTASGPAASIAGLEGLLVTTLAEIVGTGVDDDGALELV